MKCDEIRELLIDFLDGSLETGQQGQVDVHVTECDSCRERLDELKAVFGALRSYKPPERDELFWKRMRKNVSDNVKPSQPAISPMRRAAKPAAALVAALLFVAIVSVYNMLHAPQKELSIKMPKIAASMETLTNREKALIVATIDTKLYRDTEYKAKTEKKDTDEALDDEDFPFDDIDASEVDSRHLKTLDTGVPGEYKIPNVVQEMTDEEAEEILDAMSPEPDESKRSAVPGKSMS